jgi:hypothetical protein
MPRAVLRLHAQRGHLKNLRSQGASTVELAIFFTLVAAILGSVTLFLTGTLPQMYASARLANTLEGATLVKPRLGAMHLHALPPEQLPASYSHKAPSLALADNRPQMFEALSLESEALSKLLELAFPANHEEPRSCLSVYLVEARICSFASDSVTVELESSSGCPDGTQIQCVVAQAEAILKAKGCADDEAAPTWLAAFYPRENGFLKSPCAVTELGYPRVIEH